MSDASEEPALPEGVPAVWYMGQADGTPVNGHRFRGGMRHDGALWCVACERFERLDGQPFEKQAAPVVP